MAHDSTRAWPLGIGPDQTAIPGAAWLELLDGQAFPVVGAGVMVRDGNVWTPASSSNPLHVRAQALEQLIGALNATKETNPDAASASMLALLRGLIAVVGKETTLAQSVDKLNSILSRLGGKLDTAIFDSQGNPISVTNRLPVEATLSGSDKVLPVELVGRDSFKTPLASQTQRRLSPTGPLRWRPVAPTDGRLSALRYLTIGAHDRKLYGLNGGSLFMMEDVTDPGTIQTGVTFTSSGYGFPVHMHVSQNGIWVLTRWSTETKKEMRLYYFESVTASPQLLQTFEIPPEDTVNTFNCASYCTGLNDIIIFGVYGPGQRNRELVATFDGGQTLDVIKTTTSGVDPDPSVNSHWHAVAFDGYSGRIWAAEGDGMNRAINWSDDLGATWQRITGKYQPTLIIPMPDRVVFGEDASSERLGLREYYRPQTAQEDEGVVLRDVLTFRPHLGAHAQYPDYPPTGTGVEQYVLFPPQTVPYLDIYATGDGGRSWHNVYSANTAFERVDMVVGPTHDRKLAARVRSGFSPTAILLVAEAPEWV